MAHGLRTMIALNERQARERGVVAIPVRREKEHRIHRIAVKIMLPSEEEVERYGNGKASLDHDSLHHEKLVEDISFSFRTLRVFP